MSMIVAVVWGLFAIGLHVYGMRRDWYQQYNNFDNLTHSISGGGLMYLLLVVASAIGLPVWSAWPVFFSLVALWEVYEYIAGKPSYLWNSWTDMIHDTIFGTVAAAVVYGVMVL